LAGRARYGAVTYGAVFGLRHRTAGVVAWGWSSAVWGESRQARLGRSVQSWVRLGTATPGMAGGSGFGKFRLGPVGVSGHSWLRQGRLGLAGSGRLRIGRLRMVAMARYGRRDWRGSVVPAGWLTAWLAGMELLGLVMPGWSGRVAAGESRHGLLKHFIGGASPGRAGGVAEGLARSPRRGILWPGRRLVGLPWLGVSRLTKARFLRAGVAWCPVVDWVRHF
jgi:hypothetical protein